jgi:tRNA-2-methylthio-N6-dimethylallyladenosine synthase
MSELKLINIRSSINESGAINSLNKMKPGVFIKTFGCQMNEYDTQKLLTILAPEYSQVENEDDAELLIVNTCSIREKAEHKLYSLLGELRDRKKVRPELIIGVGGCVAQQEGESIVKRNDAVDFVFGTHNLSLVPSLISKSTSLKVPQIAVDYRDEWEELPFGLTGGSKVSAYVSISRGCNKNCTYCIVPTTRGVEVSRPIHELLREVRIAAHRGAKEIILLGQTVNSYGLDLVPKYKFSQLLDTVAAVEGVSRIRFTSPHPQEVKDDFIEVLVNNPKVCRHIHMPLQSGSDKILRAMNRNYRQNRYLKIIEQLKDKIPDIAITTDIIVGFPGETEADFQETLEVMRKVRFQNSYSFIFSSRPGTMAAQMVDNVTIAEKKDRLSRLQALQDELCTEELLKWQDKVIEVLIDGPSKSEPKLLHGRSSQSISVNLVKPYQNIQLGDLVNVRVVEVGRYTLRGEIAV